MTMEDRDAELRLLKILKKSWTFKPSKISSTVRHGMIRSKKG